MDIRFPKFLGWGYFVSGSLVFCSLLFLSFMAYKALDFQAHEEIFRRENQARQRILEAEESFTRKFPQEAEAKNDLSIKLPFKKINLRKVKIPAFADEWESYIKLSLASEAKNLELLQIFWNSEEQEKVFWLFLLLKKAEKSGNSAEFSNYLKKILELQEDWRLPDGFSIKAAATLSAAKKASKNGKTEEALSWLIQMSEFAIPEPFPKSSDKLGFEKSHPSVKMWMNLILSGWGEEENKSKTNRPFVAMIRGQLRAFPGEEIAPRLAKALNQVAGKEFQVDVFPYLNSDAEEMKIIPGWSLKIRSLNSLNERPFLSGRILLGFIFALGFISLAVLVLYGVKREQERVLFSEQEWIYRQAAHDLKTPLTSLRALAETLTLGKIPTENQKQMYLEKIIQETDRATDFVDTMLMAARLKAGFLKPSPESINPAERIPQILECFSPRLENWNVEVKIDTGIVLVADPAMWERVLINLIENVLRHANKEKEILVSLSFPEKTKSGNRAELRIGDRGEISPDVQFTSDPGFSFQNRDLESKRRMGIGLSLVKMAVEVHGGAISFLPREGKGLWVITTWPASKI
ncbi:MAG: HAMP domain-containing histidine kinase [Candidatus Riflebacteria bacterium]|nr:HAMP domain-containing histidine kinase [Candidatus Riflebacteria bacterium]